MDALRYHRISLRLWALDGCGRAARHLDCSPLRREGASARRRDVLRRAWLRDDPRSRRRQRAADGLARHIHRLVVTWLGLHRHVHASDPADAKLLPGHSAAAALKERERGTYCASTDASDALRHHPHHVPRPFRSDGTRGHCESRAATARQLATFARAALRTWSYAYHSRPSRLVITLFTIANAHRSRSSSSVPTAGRRTSSTGSSSRWASAR